MLLVVVLVVGPLEVGPLVAGSPVNVHGNNAKHCLCKITCIILILILIASSI